MQWQYSPYALPLLAASASLVLIAFYAWRRRGTPGAAPLALLMVAGAEWGLAYALSLCGVDPSTKYFWDEIKYLGIVAVPPAWLIFALSYTGRGGWLTPRFLSLLAIEPIVTMSLIFTNEEHGLFWLSRNPLRLEPVAWGPWFWVHTAYSYALIFVGTVLLIRALVSSAHLYRGQRIALVIGALVPWLGNAANVSGLIPSGYPDPAPFAFVVTGLAFLWALFRYGLLDVVPVARSALIEGMSDGMMVLDTRNRIVDLNPAARLFLSRPASEVVGRGIAQVSPGVAAMLDRHHDAEEGHEEVTVLGSGAAPRSHEVTFSPLRKRDGLSTGWLILIRDVTERVRAEEALRESEERFRAFFENTALGISIAGPDRKLLETNHAYQKMVGYSGEELFGKPIAELSFPEDVPEDWEATGDLLAGKTGRYQREKRYLRKDGGFVWVRPTISVVLDAGGSPRFLIGVVEDITERKQAEEELRRSEHELAEAQRIGRVGSWSFDVDRNEARWSDEMYRIFGYAPQEFVVTYRKLLGLLHPEDKKSVFGAIKETVRGKKDRYSLDCRLVRPNGETRFLHNQYEVLRDVSGRPFRLVGTSQDITERKALEEELEHQALHDALTRLPNRTLFTNRLEHALSRTGRRGGNVAVLFADLDNFKYVNDTLGHHMGDELLSAVSNRLRRCLRPGDTAARLGGDEFAALLEDVKGTHEATLVAQRIIEELRAPFFLDGHEVVVTPSIGIALGESGRRLPEDLVRDADVAMYRAKEEGKARYQVFDPGMEGRVKERLKLENDLRRALERDEFGVYYQPVVAIDTGRIVGMEALARWEHPERGLVPPSEFVPLAEELGLIISIGRLVLREACRQTREWQRRYPSEQPLIVGVNLSARQLRYPGLVEDVGAALRESGLEHACLTLEITESAVVGQEERHIDILRVLRSLGARFALDDFGVGYSSLSYLKRLPVGTLNIDRSFVGRIGEDAEGEILVSGMVHVARGLGMRVLAEGVETPEQLARVRDLGCDLAQGYYFSKPLPAGAAEDLLATRDP